MGEIISFYSYKGGVGRSMALANIAALLAQQGQRVLAVDFDLDAPGLHRYFLRKDTTLGESRSIPCHGQRGVIEMFIEIRTRLLEEATPAEPGGSPQDARPAIPSIVRRLIDDPNYGYAVRMIDPAGGPPASLKLIAAGRFDDEYASRVQAFPWKELYEEHAELFGALVSEWRKRYDYVLIDSRTGVTDIGSVSTVILPDKLVLAFTPNEQSLHGAIEVGRQAIALKRDLGATKPLALFPLISRVDEGEEILRRSWMREAAQRFTSLFTELYGPTRIDFVSYFDAVHVPHNSYYAYGERIAAEEDTSVAFGSLTAGYARFLDCLRGERLAGWEERVRDPLRERTREYALVASFETPFEAPEPFESERVVKIPEGESPSSSRLLRDVPIRADAWEQALAEIDLGVSRAAMKGRGDLHVFATMPYPAAVYLGRRLDDLARARPPVIHQLDPGGSWVPFSARASEPESGAPKYYADLEEVLRAPDSDAVLLVLEGARQAGDGSLAELASRLGGAAIYRLRPQEARALAPSEAAGAVDAMRTTLLRLQRNHPRAALHVVATAPVALLIELGRLVTPTVYRSVVVHQYDPQTSAYVPVLDVIARRVVSWG